MAGPAPGFPRPCPLPLPSTTTPRLPGAVVEGVGAEGPPAQRGIPFHPGPPAASGVPAGPPTHWGSLGKAAAPPGGGCTRNRLVRQGSGQTGFSGKPRRLLGSQRRPGSLWISLSCRTTSGLRGPGPEIPPPLRHPSSWKTFPGVLSPTHRFKCQRHAPGAVRLSAEPQGPHL